MGDTIIFTVLGEPVAKARARAVRRNGSIAHYTPAKTASYEAQVRLFAKAAMKGRPPIDGACALVVRAYFPIPKSWGKEKQREAAAGKIAHTKRPDLDNIVKSIKDGANGAAWKDDAQVTCVFATKGYGVPRVDVEVRKVV